MIRLSLPAAVLLLIAAPAGAQSSWPTTIGSTPAPALGITPGITLGIAAAATANDHPATANSSAQETKKRTALALNAPVPLRNSTR